MKMKRREAREAAFALLFEWSFKESENLSNIIAQATDARDLDIDTFTIDLTSRAMDNVEEIDSLIAKYSQKWKINRISKITLAALRLALSELLYFADIPPGATINEAVELVKKYGTEDEAAYLNGILGSYVRENLPDEGQKEDVEEIGSKPAEETP